MNPPLCSYSESCELSSPLIAHLMYNTKVGAFQFSVLNVLRPEGRHAVLFAACRLQTKVFTKEIRLDGF